MNAIGQRSNVATSGTAFVSSRDTAWAYDFFGQITRADSTIPGLDRAYALDMIGNRLKTADSLTLQAANNYTPNALKQYSQITNNSITNNPAFDADGNATEYPLLPLGSGAMVSGVLHRLPSLAPPQAQQRDLFHHH